METKDMAAVIEIDITSILRDIEAGKYRDCYLIYNRKSTDDTQNQKNTLPYQRQLNMGYVRLNKLPLAKITIPGFCKDGIIDEAHSAFKEEDEFILLPDGSVQYRILRVKFGRLVELLKSKKIKGVVILCWDRGSRNEHDDMLIKKLMKLGCDIRFVEANYEKTSSGELHMDIDGMFAAHYSRVISEKVKKAHVKLRAERRCLYLSPIGYMDHGSDNKPLDPVRAPLVRQMFELYGTGKYGFRSLVTWADENGLTKKPSRRKRTSEEILNNVEPESIEKTVRPLDIHDIEHILRNRFYLGEVRLGKDTEKKIVWGKSIAHQALIDTKTFNEVQRLMKTRQQSVYYVEKEFYTYRKLLRCSCGRSITPYKTKGNTYYRSQCADGCDNPDINLSDDDVETGIQDLLDQIHYTEEEKASIEAEASMKLYKISESRDRKLDSLHSRQKKIVADLDYITQNRIMLLRTGAMTAELIVEDEKRLSTQLDNVHIEIAAYGESAPAMLRYVMQFSELVKDASKYYRFALDNEKREMAMEIFSELVFRDRKLIKYTAKDGFGALLGRSASSGAGRETRTLKGLPPHDFESCAYTIPPFRQWGKHTFFALFSEEEG